MTVAQVWDVLVVAMVVGWTVVVLGLSMVAMVSLWSEKRRGSRNTKGQVR